MESQPETPQESTPPGSKTAPDEPVPAVTTRETVPVWARTVPVVLPDAPDSLSTAAEAEPLTAKPMQKGDPAWTQADSLATTEASPAVPLPKEAPLWAQTVPHPTDPPAAEAESTTAAITETPKAVASDAAGKTWPPAEENATAPPAETDIWPPEPPTERAMPAWPPSANITDPAIPSDIPETVIPSWPDSFDAVSATTQPQAEPAGAQPATIPPPAASPPPPVASKPPPAAPVIASKPPPAAPPVASKPPPAAPVIASKPPPAAPVIASKPPPAAPVIASKAPKAPAVAASKPPTAPPAQPVTAALPSSAEAPPPQPPPAPPPVQPPAPSKPVAPAQPRSAGYAWAPVPRAAAPEVDWPAPVEIPSWAPRIHIGPEPVAPPPKPAAAPVQPDAAQAPAPPAPAQAPGGLPVAPARPSPRRPAQVPAPPGSPKSSWEVVQQQSKAKPVEAVPTPEDRSYAEWFAWAKRGGAPASACHAAAQGAFQALAGGKDVATAVQWATAAMSRPPAAVSASRQTYCAWFSLANIDLSMDQHRAHAFAAAAVQALDAGADAATAHAAGLAAAGIR